METTPNTVYVGSRITVRFEIDDIIGLKNISFEIFGKNHTLTAYSGVYNYSWIASESGTVNYKIHMEDLTRYNNSMSGKIIIYVPPDDDDDDDTPAIPGYNTILMVLMLLGAMFVILLKTRLKMVKEK